MAAKKRARATRPSKAIKTKPQAPRRLPRSIDDKVKRAIADEIKRLVRPIVAEQIKELKEQLTGPPAPPVPPPSTPPAAGGGGDKRHSHDSASTNPFAPDLEANVIALPLNEAMECVDHGKEPSNNISYDKKRRRFPVIIDLNLEYPGGRSRARHRVLDLIASMLHSVQVKGSKPAATEPRRSWQDTIPARFRDASPQYVFAELHPEEIRELVRLDNGWAPDPKDRTGETRGRRKRAIFRIWPSHPVKPQVYKSSVTIKADAAIATFGASGAGVVWAVVDSGISGAHRHFDLHGNLRNLPDGVSHKDFTGAVPAKPLKDVYRHGTHVAGIIAGEVNEPCTVLTSQRDEIGNSVANTTTVDRIRSVAPKCKLVSYKVLDDFGKGDIRNVIAALEDVARTNADGRNIRIHGVNLSLGYPFDAKWYACGQSAVCEVVDRLVRTGVVVVAAAGNTGYATFEPTMARGSWSQGVSLSINDPGNAELAITVGSTHRDAPHMYGTSYFSSKGPTGDGRPKPDLLAPGERIISASSADLPEGTQADGKKPVADYREETGTSMAAPHVSGAVAAFLSVRSEFKGRAETVKHTFLRTATDLKRERYMQGAGLVDLMRALQSV